MNIFPVSKCPVESATFLPDKLLVKLILENAQMLSTAMVEHRPMTVHNKTWKLTYKWAHFSPYLAFWCRCQPMYAPAHVKHPCTLWTKVGDENWMWLYLNATAMHDEYRLRYGANKTHKSFPIVEQLGKWIDWIPSHNQTEHPQCMPDEMIIPNDPQLAYRRYIKTKPYFENGFKKGRDFTAIYDN